MALGLDFGTESVRAILMGEGGATIASAVERYAHGQITGSLPGSTGALPAKFALQHPMDWLESAGRAVRSVLKAAGSDGAGVVGVGVDFTSCTMLPALQDGTPMMMRPEFAQRAQAWPKLWKHHGAQRQADEINALARQRGEGWLARYGGAVGLEWLLPKIVEIYDSDREVFERAEVFVEAGDWFVWWMIGGPARALPRSTCQAGYKACWSARDGYPSSEFFDSLRSGMGSALQARLPGRFVSPGVRAGWLTPKAAEHLGLERALGGGNGLAGVAVSAAVIDAHSAVPGVGAAETGDLVLVLGTSGCHMYNGGREEMVEGVAGIVPDGIIPGQVGYEMGQAAVGDAFAWLSRITGRDLDDLARAAGGMEAGAGGVVCLDWLNGCRTPLMDGNLRGGFLGLTLATRPEEMYRAMLEGLACGCRWIVELLEGKGLEVNRVFATGGLSTRGDVIAQVWADVLGKEMLVSGAEHATARGAALYGFAAAEGLEGTALAHSMNQRGAGLKARRVAPGQQLRGRYEEVYRRYRALAGYERQARQAE